jgi:two-component system response regulator
MLDEKLTVRALERSSVQFAIHVVRDGVEALEFLFCNGKYSSRTPHMPDLFLVDLKVPKLGGLDLIKRLRSQPSTRIIPIVVLTSSIETKDVFESYMSGANSYIRKQVDFVSFSEAIKKISAYWLQLNVPPSPGALKASVL